MCQDEAMMAVRDCDHPSGDHIVAPTKVNQFSMKIKTIKQAKTKLLKKQHKTPRKLILAAHLL